MRMRRKRLKLNSCILAFLVFLIAYLDVACTKSGSNPAPTESGKHDEQVTALPSAASIECYDFFEMTLRVDKPAARNPFRDVKVSGHFGLIAKGTMLAVDGFCDDPDGTVFRIRFMPAQAGDYAYSVTYRRGGFEWVYAGTFKAIEGKRAGILRVDVANPWRSIWEGSGDHFFPEWNHRFPIDGLE